MHFVSRDRHFSKSTTVIFLLACLSIINTLLKIRDRRSITRDKEARAIFTYRRETAPLMNTHPQFSICISHSFLYTFPSDPQTDTSGSFLQSKGHALLPDVRSRDMQNDIGTSKTCLLENIVRLELDEIFAMQLIKFRHEKLHRKCLFIMGLSISQLLVGGKIHIYHTLRPDKS